MPPSSPRISIMIPATVTQDKKWGRYTSVWILFLTPICLISLNRIAMKIGTIMPTIILMTAMMSVLVMACVASLYWKILAKLSQPIHAEPVSPSQGL
ncbi:hypothetical protein D3C81_1459300 [compost metagenome]